MESACWERWQPVESLCRIRLLPQAIPVAAALLLRLESLTGKEEYAAKAQATIENFADVVEHFGLFAATYGLALQSLVQDPIQGVRDRR